MRLCRFKKAEGRLGFHLAFSPFFLYLNRTDLNFSINYGAY